MEPTSAAVPDSLSEETIAFSKFGVRVPTILVSPCISKGVIFIYLFFYFFGTMNIQIYLGIDNTLYDHTSVLKYVLNKWAPDAVHRLGERVLAANTLPVLSTPRDEAFPPYHHSIIHKSLFDVADYPSQLQRKERISLLLLLLILP